MFWTALFSIGIAQGLFLVTLIMIKGRKNFLASRLISIMIFLMMLSNFGYLAIRTELLYYIPQVYGLSFGSLFLFGPLLYFYSKAVLVNGFQWRRKNWLHFLPFLIQATTAIPWFLNDSEDWIVFIRTFLAGNLIVELYPKIVYAAQNFHLLIYIILTSQRIRLARQEHQQAKYVVPVSSRVRWLTGLTMCLALLLAAVFSMYIFVIAHGKFNPVTNYIYTVVTSGIIYFMAYSYVLNPELITPDFLQKYRTYMPFDGDIGERYLEKLKSLMDHEKLYVNPDLKLADLAEALSLPLHQVSKLINDKFGKSFTDLINAYRVQEFIDRVNRPEYQSHSVFGLALDVGFNSKSAFNSAFKKLTGKTPSEYRHESEKSGFSSPIL